LLVVGLVIITVAFLCGYYHYCVDQAPMFDCQPYITLVQVPRQWAIMKVVRSCISRVIASMITASVLVSTELVGSSRMRIGASLRNARASDMRWRSPPSPRRQWLG
jgi:hypothetical protein